MKAIDIEKRRNLSGKKEKMKTIESSFHKKKKITETPDYITYYDSIDQIFLQNDSFELMGKFLESIYL